MDKEKLANRRIYESMKLTEKLIEKEMMKAEKIRKAIESINLEDKPKKTGEKDDNL